jgi:hypothetical protein
LSTDVSAHFGGRTDDFSIKISPVEIPVGNSAADFDEDGKTDLGGVMEGGLFFVLGRESHGDRFGDCHRMCH